MTPCLSYSMFSCSDKIYTQNDIKGGLRSLYPSFVTAEKRSLDSFREKQHVCSMQSWSARRISALLIEELFVFGKDFDRLWDRFCRKLKGK